MENVFIAILSVSIMAAAFMWCFVLPTLGGLWLLGVL